MTDVRSARNTSKERGETKRHYSPKLFSEVLEDFKYLEWEYVGNNAYRSSDLQMMMGCRNDGERRSGRWTESIRGLEGMLKLRSCMACR